MNNLINNKQIIITVGIIFIALVGYKIISSSIQESKEKAVLQERAQLDQLAKEPLNQCIDEINNNAENEIKRNRELALDISSPKSQEECINFSGDKEYCKPPSFQELQVEAEQIRAKAKIDRDECYKRYK
ncbi:MAG: hypothetical protein WA060_00355 [Minisyncoccia bacterium]